MVLAISWSDLLSMILVGAVWGCTNPFVRKGSLEKDEISQKKDKDGGGQEADGNDESIPSSASSGVSSRNKKEREGRSRGFVGFVCRSLSPLLHVRVWIPYTLNQCGSLLYYKLLATSNLSLSVPICNALSLVFSSVTSALLGERVDEPIRAALGVVLVIVGVGICVVSSSNEHVANVDGDGTVGVTDEL